MKNRMKKIVCAILALAMVVTTLIGSIGVGSAAENPGPSIIEKTMVNVDFSKMEGAGIGKSIKPLFDIVLVKASSTAPSVSLDWNEFAVKATEEHVSKGYISQDAYDDADYGWVPCNEYDMSYVMNENDVYGIICHVMCSSSDWIFAEAIGDDITSKLMTTTDGVTIEKAVAMPYMSDDPMVAMVYLNLGTGAKLDAKINPGTSQPEDPSEGDDGSSEAPFVPVETVKDFDAALTLQKDVPYYVALSELEKEWIADGKEMALNFSFEEKGKDVNTDEQAAIKEAANGKTVGWFFDVNLELAIGGTARAVTETTEKMEISFKLPEELKNTDATKTREFTMMRNHDGVVSELETVFDSKTGVVTFKTDRFSTYALAYSDKDITPAGGNEGETEKPDDTQKPEDTTGKEETNKNDTTTEKEENKNNTVENNKKEETTNKVDKDKEPQTGDASSILFYTTMMILSLGCIVAYRKKALLNK